MRGENSMLHQCIADPEAHVSWLKFFDIDSQSNGKANANDNYEKWIEGKRGIIVSEKR